jgi:hypothetical protein
MRCAAAAGPVPGWPSPTSASSSGGRDRHGRRSVPDPMQADFVTPITFSDGPTAANSGPHHGATLGANLGPLNHTGVCEAPPLTYGVRGVLTSS